MTSTHATTEGLMRVLHTGAELVAGVRDDQWSAATGCSDRTVGTRVDHLVGNNLAFAALLSDQVPAGRGADHLGDDPVAA